MKWSLVSISPDDVSIAKVWKLLVGRVPLYLMDTDITPNAPADRELLARLYAGDREMRIAQEIVLGIGGCACLACPWDLLQMPGILTKDTQRFSAWNVAANLSHLDSPSMRLAKLSKRTRSSRHIRQCQQAMTPSTLT